MIVVRVVVGPWFPSKEFSHKKQINSVAYESKFLSNFFHFQPIIKIWGFTV